jgi:hypothetical protein
VHDTLDVEKMLNVNITSKRERDKSTEKLLAQRPEYNFINSFIPSNKNLKNMRSNYDLKENIFKKIKKINLEE